MMPDVESQLSQLTAYERWELPSLDQETDPATEKKRQQLLQQAQQQGYQEGFAQGLAEGQQAGAEHVQTVLKTLTETIAYCQDPKSMVDQQFEHSLMALVQACVEHVLGEVLEHQPQYWQHIIDTALKALTVGGAQVDLYCNENTQKKLEPYIAHAPMSFIQADDCPDDEIRLRTRYSEVDLSKKSLAKCIAEGLKASE